MYFEPTVLLVETADTPDGDAVTLADGGTRHLRNKLSHDGGNTVTHGHMQVAIGLASDLLDSAHHLDMGTRCLCERGGGSGGVLGEIGQCITVGSHLRTDVQKRQADYRGHKAE